ncbi:MAG TPA: carbohydrate kinase family protein, partial [Gammaproteobacteria bacterium]|nr:carbohydrate kinase family protein [Gammaproteobacteria bacterium]
MSALICGSFAYDNIMVFQGYFKNHILPDKIHMLNVSFLVEEMRREYGGCAGNIAYNLHLLGGDPIPMGVVGSDFAPYAAWMDECGLNRSHVAQIKEAFTAQAFITTDLDDNQITAFHPGAMNYAAQNNVAHVDNVSIGIIAPDGRDGMIQHAQQFVEIDVPFIFDPGQGMPMFECEDLKRFIEQSTWVTVNDYEAELMQERTGWSADDIAQRVEALIVTCGGDGSRIYANDSVIEIPNAAASPILDPTGCGDAYRAGLLYGLMNGLEWETTGRIASLCGAI